MRVIDKSGRDDLITGDDLDGWLCDKRAQVNQVATRGEHAPDFIQGMNHALARNSSQ